MSSVWKGVMADKAKSIELVRGDLAAKPELLDGFNRVISAIESSDFPELCDLSGLKRIAGFGKSNMLAMNLIEVLSSEPLFIFETDCAYDSDYDGTYDILFEDALKALKTGYLDHPDTGGSIPCDFSQIEICLTLIRDLNADRHPIQEAV